MVHLFNNQAGAGHQVKDGLSDCPQYLPHKNEPADLYQKYQVKLRKAHKNPSNLFDDSDTMDRYWFNLAKRHLKKAGSRLDKANST